MLDSVVYLGIVLYIVYTIIDYLIRLPKVDRFHEKYVLITGCDSGFGKDASLRLFQMGFYVFSGCLTKEGEEDLRQATSQRLIPLHMDVTSKDSIKKAYDLISDRIPKGKGLWAVINNAGIPGKTGPIVWFNSDPFREAMDVNLFPHIDIANTFLPLLEDAKGRIINVGSALGHFSNPNSGPYSAAKAAVEAVSDGYRRCLKYHGVSVHVIIPGFFSTNIINVDGHKPALVRSWESTSERLKKQYPEDSIEHYNASGKRTTNLLKNNQTSLVVDAFVNAVTDYCPRPRYVIGYDARFFFLPVQKFVPEWIADRFVTRENYRIKNIQ